MSFDKLQYDVVLVETPTKYVVERYDQPNYPAIGVAYVGNYLEKNVGITPAIIDAKLGRKTIEETIKYVVALKPKIVGLSSMTHNIKVAAYIAFEIKKYLPDTITVMGGFHATFLPEQTLKEFPTFDYVSVGESEVAWLKFVDAILNNNGSPKDIKGMWYEKNGKITKMGRGEIPETLDELGEPGWHLFDQEIIHKYAGEMPIMAMRGCPFSCNFCSRPYGQLVRLRSSKLIVDEIEKNQKRYNINFFNFWDETFTINKLHTKALCQELIKRKLNIEFWCQTHANTFDLETAKLMKEAGCYYAGLGVESGNDEILKKMNKGAKKENILRAREILKEVNIRTCCFLIFGHPFETYKSIIDSIKFASKVNCEETQIGIMVPYPGTEIYDMALKGEGGYVKMSIDWDDYNKQMGNAVELKNISRKKLEMLQLVAYFWLYIVNGRWSDLYKMVKASGFSPGGGSGPNIWRLILSIIMKVLGIQKLAKKMFMNTGEAAVIGETKRR